MFENRNQIIGSLIFAVAVSIASSSIAVAAEAVATQPAATVAAPATAEAPSLIVSDGAKYQINSGLSITPPKDWEVQTKPMGMTLILQEPKSKEPVKDFSKPTFQRNITLVTMHHASPIDAIRAEELKTELQKTFDKQGSVSNFQITEQKFFNYRGTDDAILIYSTMKMGEFDMMQMHILISGQDKQYLMTYTDLAAEFLAKNGNVEKAWNSIVSIEVNGIAPKRYVEYIPFAVGGGVLIVLMCVIGFLRRRAARNAYSSAADEIYSDSAEVTTAIRSQTMSAIWSLKSGNEGVEFGSAVSNF